MSNRRSTFFYGDPHFFHDAIIKYCERPYNNAIEMNQDYIKKYNKKVRENDIVYFLGDVGRGAGLRDVILQLPGKKVLLLGNHDNESVGHYYNLGFSAVMKAAVIDIGKTTFSLSHYPKRNIFEILNLFFLYIMKMLKRGRNTDQIKNRLKKEWKMYFNTGTYKHIHGHTHSKLKIKGKNIHVGVDAWDGYPVSDNEVLNLIKN